MILLKNLTIKNFLSHASTEIKFQPNQKLLISGSSGSGKSGIVDSIVWCLYGVGRTSNRDIIKKNKKIAKVTLELIDENITYRVERSVTDKGKNELNIYEKIKDGNFKSIKVIGLRSTQEYLEREILHSSYILFINSIVSPQNPTESFVQQNSSRRKDLLLEIINASKFDEYLTKTKEKLNEFIQDKSNNDSVLININQSLADDKILAIELPALQTEEQIKKKEIEQVNEHLKGLTTQLAEINYKIKTKSEKEKELNTLNTIILPTIRTEIETLTSKIKELENLDVAKLQEEVADLDAFKTKLQSFKATEQLSNRWNISMMEIIKDKPLARNFDNEIAEINKQLITLLSQPEEKCPKCGFVLSNLYRDSNIKRLQEELITRNKEKVEYVKAEDIYFKKIEGLGAQPSVDRVAMSELETTISTKEKRKVEIDNIIKNREWDKKVREGKLEDKKKEMGEKEIMVVGLFGEIKNLEAEIVGGEIVKKEEEKLVSEKVILENAYNILIGKLSIAQEALKKVNINEEKVKVLVGENEKLGENIELLELLKGAFSPNGLKAIVIDYILPMLEDKINSVLSQLSSFRIKLSTQKLSVDGEKTIEGLWITIVNDQNEEMAFESYSGGEKTSLNVSIFEGLASMQKFGFRIFDETILGLDNTMIENFGTVILKLKENINQLLIISHIPAVQEIFTEKIEIRKVNGTSQIVLDN